MGAKVNMASSDHLNPDQHMSVGHIKKITSNRDVRNMLEKLVDNDVKFVLSDSTNHHQLKIIGDGIVTLSKSPSDHRAVKNMQSDIRKNIRQSIDPEWNFPK